MSRLLRTIAARLRRDERGAVLSFFAVALLALLLFASFVIDVGNWFTHKRQLQLRVDAGALAGSAYFSTCFADATLGNTQIENAARNYAGSPTAPGVAYNNQFPNQPNVHVLINAEEYWNHGGTEPSDAGGKPCGKGYVDVKATDANVPWLIRAINLLPGDHRTDINAQARVQIFQATQRSGNLPVAVPDPGRVTSVAAEFFDEQTLAPVGPNTRLERDAANPLLYEKTISGVDLSTVRRLGLRIKVSGADPPPSVPQCGQPLTDCYNGETLDASDFPRQGLVYAHGYPEGGISTATGEPLARAVALTTTDIARGCPFEPYFVYQLGGSCRVGVIANVDFGTIPKEKAKVFAMLAGVERELKPDDTGKVWSSTDTGSPQNRHFEIEPDLGALEMTLR